jgi:hypothetical protein
MRLSNPFKKNFANTKTLLHPLKGLKIIVVLMQIHVPETELAAEQEAPETSAGNAAGRRGISSDRSGNPIVAAQGSKSFGVECSSLANWEHMRSTV